MAAVCCSGRIRLNNLKIKKKGNFVLEEWMMSTLHRTTPSSHPKRNTKYQNNSSPHSSSSFISAHMFNSNYPSNLVFPSSYSFCIKQKGEKQICRNLRCAFDFIVFDSIRSVAGPSAFNCFLLLTLSLEMDVVCRSLVCRLQSHRASQ